MAGKKTGNLIFRDLEIKESGTMYSKEFAAFLKKLGNNAVSANSVAKDNHICGMRLSRNLLRL